MQEIIKKVIDYTLGILLFWGFAIIIIFSVGYIFKIGANALNFVIGVAITLLITHTFTTYISDKIPRGGIILLVAIEWFAIYLYLR